jgi:general secretion pathway protein D
MLAGNGQSYGLAAGKGQGLQGTMMRGCSSAEERAGCDTDGEAGRKIGRPGEFGVKASTEQLTAGADRMLLQPIRNWGSMTRSTLYFSLFVSLIFFVGGVPQAHAKSAKHWYKLGQRAEAQNQMEQAYQEYYKAYKMKPGDERFRIAFERTRLPASALHVEHGEQLEKLGDNSGAVAEFLLALQIDPSNELATQDIEAIRRKVNALKTGTNAESPRTPEEAFERLEGPVHLRPLSDEPLTLHMVEDSKVVYQTVCKAAGINVLFDPDYQSKRIQVDLQNTTFRQALQIIATVSGTFYQAITPNTIFVAANTRVKRTELETQAVQTFYLHNVTQQSDFTDIQTALRNVFQTAHIFGVASQNAIVMRASPDELILAKKLISDLDRPKPEVVVDVAVLEVSRNLERKIGLQLPQTASVNIQAATSSSSSSGTSTGTTPTTSGNLTLNNLAHLNSNNFAVTIGQAQADLLLSDSSTQVIQEPRIRASDGQDAQLKIGERLPVATGSYQTGAATAIVSSLVNTQFQYLDVGVNIDVTPTVLYDRDVSMKVKLTVSAENGTENLGGVNEPIITQRVADETVRLKNGEANLIGGIKQVQVSNSVSGTPGLAELPLLKYIFGVHDHTVTDDDLVFLLIPHVIRAQMLTPEQTAAIYTGTANNFSVRMASQPVSGAKTAVSGQSSGAAEVQGAGAAAKQPNVAAPSASGAPPAAAVTAPTAEGAAKSAMQQMNAQMGSGPPVLLQLDPQQTSAAVGKTFQLKVNLEDGKDVYAVPMRLKYDAARLSLINVDLTGSPQSPSSFLGKDGQAVALVHRDDGNGQVEISASRPPGVAGVSGSGTVCVLTFKAKAAGDATVAITRPVIRNSREESIPAVGSLAVVHVE